MYIYIYVYIYIYIYIWKWLSISTDAWCFKRESLKSVRPSPQSHTPCVFQQRQGSVYAARRQLSINILGESVHMDPQDCWLSGDQGPTMLNLWKGYLIISPAHSCKRTTLETHTTQASILKWLSISTDARYVERENLKSVRPSPQSYTPCVFQQHQGSVYAARMQLSINILGESVHMDSKDFWLSGVQGSTMLNLRKGYLIISPAPSCKRATLDSLFKQLYWNG